MPTPMRSLRYSSRTNRGRVDRCGCRGGEAAAIELSASQRCPMADSRRTVRSGKRLVVMLENQTGGADAPWLINGFEFTQETPFTLPTADGFTCDPNRGSSGVRPNAVRTLTSLPSTSPRWAMSRKSSTH